MNQYLDEDSIWQPLIHRSLPLELEMFDNRTGRRMSTPLPTTADEYGDGIAIPSKLRQSVYSITSISGNLAFVLFVAFYVYQSVVSASPLLGRIFFTPSTTVFVINVMAQFLAVTLSMLITDAFEAFRWHLASKESGALLNTFLALSRATSAHGV